MTGGEKPDPEDIFERIIDGGPVISTTKKAAGKFFNTTFEALEEQLKRLIKENVPDKDGLNKDIENMTKDIIIQLRKRINHIFPNSGPDKPSGD